MARAKRQFPTGKYRQHLPKSPKMESAYPIELEYSWDGIVKRVPTGISANYSDWNPKGNNGKGELLPSFGSDYKKHNDILLRRVERYDALMAEYADNHPNSFTIEVVETILRNEGVEQKDFVDFVVERLKSEYMRNKIGRSRFENGISAMNMFQEFLRSEKLGTYKDDSLYLSQITVELFEAYIDWRIRIKKNSTATINHTLTPIIKACQYACDIGLINSRLNLCIRDLRVKEKVSLEEDCDEAEVFNGKILTAEQMRALIEYGNNCKLVKRKEYIDMFLFAFHACGLRVVDVATLQWNSVNFEKKELRKVLIKTSKRHIIPLSDEAIEILERWKKKRPSSKFVFGLVNEDLNLDDSKALYKARTNATKCINQSLKVVGESLNFPIALTMHIARHTFSVKALNQGLSMSVVSRLLGHGSTDITEKVYARYMPETLADELGKLDFSTFVLK